MLHSGNKQIRAFTYVSVHLIMLPASNKLDHYTFLNAFQSGKLQIKVMINYRNLCISLNFGY